jgi:hypothetical protein
MNIWRRVAPSSGVVLFIWAAAALHPAPPAPADVAPRAISRIAGTVTYTGTHGPVSANRTLCVCLYLDRALTSLLTCYEVATNGGAYNISTTGTYYLIAFLDPNLDVALDPGEPFQIYSNKGAPPADPVVAGPTQTTVDFRFGDENLAGTPTASPSPTETPSPPATSTSTPPCPGDCNGDGMVTINELLSLVDTALGTAELACTAGDLDANGMIGVNEILTAINRALTSCSQP